MLEVDSEEPMTNFELIEESPCGLKRRVIRFMHHYSQVWIDTDTQEVRETKRHKWQAKARYDRTGRSWRMKKPDPITPAQQAAAVEFYRQQIQFKEW